MIFTVCPTDQCWASMVLRSMTTSLAVDGPEPATSRSEERKRSGLQLTPRVGGPCLVRALPLDLMSVTGAWMTGWASLTPGTPRTAGSAEVGTGGRLEPTLLMPPVPYGARPCTTTSTLAFTSLKRLSKLCLTVSVRTKVPAMKDTPSTMARPVSARRTL